MKLNERDSKIIQTLIKLGMNEKIAENPDAVGETLKIAEQVLEGIDIMDSEKEENIENALKGIINDEHAIFYEENSQEDTYTKGKDGEKTFDAKFTKNVKKVIDVDDKNRTTISIVDDRIFGYDRRDANHPSYIHTNSKEFNRNVAYSEGMLKGAEHIIEEKYVIENGVEVEYIQSERSEDFFDGMAIGAASGNYILPFPGREGEYLTPHFDTRGTKYDNKGFGSCDIFSYRDDGTNFRILRNKDMTTGIVEVAKNRGLEWRQLPSIYLTNERISNELNGLAGRYGAEYHDIYAAIKTMSTEAGREKISKRYEEVEAFRQDKDLQESIISNNSKLRELKEIREGTKEPEKVELTETKQQAIENINVEEIDYTKEESQEIKADEAYQHSYDLVKKEPNILKRMMGFIKDKFKRKEQNKGQNVGQNQDPEQR